MGEEKRLAVEFEDEPPVTDFVKFYPYACYQLGVYDQIVIDKVMPKGVGSETTTQRSSGMAHAFAQKNMQPERLRNMTHQSLMQLPTAEEDETADKDQSSVKIPRNPPAKEKYDEKDPKIIIKATYNKERQLTELHFRKFYNEVAANLFKILEYVIPFSQFVYKLTVSQNIDDLTLYEISKVVKLSNITELCLDDCNVESGNYSILIEEPNKIKALSLARCRINDEILQTLITKIASHRPTSNHLHVLNLSTNCITNAGAKAIAEVLRTNRYLYYLNLASNQITDDGASVIFDSLLQFRLKENEVTKYRQRYLTYVKTKKELLEKFTEQLKLEEKRDDNTNVNSKANLKSSSATAIRKKVRSRSRTRSPPIVTHRIDIKERARAMTEKQLALLEEPFDELHKKDDEFFFSGNHTLHILNLAYNDLTFLSVKKLLKVLQHQKLLAREPVGLVKVRIEGNYMPIACDEYNLIDEILTTKTQRPSKNFGKKNSRNSKTPSVSSK